MENEKSFVYLLTDNSWNIFNQIINMDIVTDYIGENDLEYWSIMAEPNSAVDHSPKNNYSIFEIYSNFFYFALKI